MEFYPGCFDGFIFFKIESLCSAMSISFFLTWTFMISKIRLTNQFKSAPITERPTQIFGQLSLLTVFPVKTKRDPYFRQTRENYVINFITSVHIHISFRCSRLSERNKFHFIWMSFAQQYFDLQTFNRRQSLNSSLCTFL